MAEWPHPMLALSCLAGCVEKVQRIYLLVFVKCRSRTQSAKSPAAIYLQTPHHPAWLVWLGRGILTAFHLF